MVYRRSVLVSKVRSRSPVPRADRHRQNMPTHLERHIGRRFVAAEDWGRWACAACRDRTTVDRRGTDFSCYVYVTGRGGPLRNRQCRQCRAILLAGYRP